jgi:tetratricopeptide (TPR) repeat protein
MEKNKIAISLLELLIENHEDGDSLVRESELVTYVSRSLTYNTNTDEISECVNLINSIANNKIIKEGWISSGGGGFLSFLSSSKESSYLTDSPVSTLSKIIELLNIETNSVQENTEFEELIEFQQKWYSMNMAEKQQIARETDRINNIGADFYNQDNFSEAIKYFEMALEVMPTNDDALKNLIICYKYIGEFDKIPAISRKLAFLDN